MHKSIETELQDHLKNFAEYKAKTTQEITQLFGRVRTAEEKAEQANDHDEMIQQRNTSVMEENVLIHKRVDDTEKELNSIQEGIFNGEVVTHRKYDPTPDEAVKCVLFHLGINHIHTESPIESLRNKLNILDTESRSKFPNAKVAFCKIPPQFSNNGDTKNGKIAQFNEEMKLLDVEFMDVKATEASLFTLMESIITSEVLLFWLAH